MCFRPLLLPAVVAGMLLAATAPASAQHFIIRGSSVIEVPGPDPYGGTNPFWGHPYYDRGRGFELYDSWNYPRHTYPVAPYASYYSMRRQTAVPPTAALVEVRVPANAELWFSGEKTSQTGAEREFLTPDLKPGKNYFYAIKARWMQDGQVVEQSRRVPVSPGVRAMVDFRMGHD